MIERDERNLDWGAYLIIHKSEYVLIGTCGFKGIPDENNFVEIGYEIARDYRNQELATEVTQLLLSKALVDESVVGIIAHTLAEKNASTRVLEKMGFSFERAIEDEENGTIWKWGLIK